MELIIWFSFYGWAYQEAFKAPFITALHKESV